MHDSPEVQEWMERRQKAARVREFREQREQRLLACGEQPTVFELSETHCRARSVARQLCEACPFRDLCLEEALAEEVGLRRGSRFGIVAGLTGHERTLMARERGCAICGDRLKVGGTGLYCEAHSVKGAREHALSNRNKAC